METYIKVEDVEKYYGSSGIITKAVERVSFEISKGEFIGIMGESGSGKTLTQLRQDTYILREKILQK